jgi:hypothetical protein
MGGGLADGKRDSIADRGLDAVAMGGADVGDIRVHGGVASVNVENIPVVKRGEILESKSLKFVEIDGGSVLEGQNVVDPKCISPRGSGKKAGLSGIAYSSVVCSEVEGGGAPILNREDKVSS